MPDLRQLRSFLVVAEELNFTRAAERLHIAQQAVSRSVAGLERELGTSLLNRTTHEVTLTPAGAALLESGREVLAAAERAFSEASAVGQGLAGSVRIGVTPAVGALVREEVARALRDGAPELAVDFREVRPRELTQLLRDRKLDLVLARTAPDLAELDSAALRPTPASLLVPADHRLAGRSAVSLADLDGERLLVWNPPGTPYTDLLINRVTAAGAEIQPVQSAVTGGGEPLALAEARAVALTPTGWPAGEDAAASLRTTLTCGSVVVARRAAPAGMLAALAALLVRPADVATARRHLGRRGYDPRGARPREWGRPRDLRALVVRVRNVRGQVIAGRVGELVLGEKSARLGTGRRKVALKPSRKLVARLGRTFRLSVVITATDGSTHAARSPARSRSAREDSNL